MAKDDPYRCLMTVRHDGRTYAVGAEIALPEAAASPLLAVPAITPAPGAPAAPPPKTRTRAAPAPEAESGAPAAGGPAP